jgi:GT2 family glycosyltransferase
MDISIIIPSYKSERYLPHCIQSLQESLFGVSYEIIIFNNAASPIEIILPSENVIIINNDSNIGFAKACNKASSVATSDILFFLNPDTELVSGNFKDLLSFFDSKTGIISPLLLTTTGKIQPWSMGYAITPFEVLRNNIGSIRSKELWLKEGDMNPDWVSGAAFAIKKSVFNKLNGFDENFFMYFEDVDLCKRIKESDLEIKILSSISIIHTGGHSANNNVSQKKQYYESQDYYFKKHFGIFYLYLLKTLRYSFLLFRK